MSTEAEQERELRLLLVDFNLRLWRDDTRLVLDFDHDLVSLEEPSVGSAVIIRTERVPAGIPYRVVSRMQFDGQKRVLLRPDDEHSFATRWHARLTARDILWAKIVVADWDSDRDFSTRAALDVVMEVVGEPGASEDGQAVPAASRPFLRLVQKDA